MEKIYLQEKLEMGSEAKIVSPFWKKNKKIKKIFLILGMSRTCFVGGAVRNAILNIESDDIDLAAKIEPAIIKQILKKHKIKFNDFSKGHGTITIFLKSLKIEITSLRRDINTYGRKADIKYTDSFYEDSCRRDFTLNSIYADFNGKLFDPHDGLTDFRNNMIKFIGVPVSRIEEDNLRIIRYFRFVARYTNNIKNIHKQSLLACADNAYLIKKVAKERIQNEFSKILLSEHASFALFLMKKYKILSYICSDFNNISSSRIKDIDHLRKDIASRLSYLVLISKACIYNIKTELRISNSLIAEVKKLSERGNIPNTKNKILFSLYNYERDTAIKKYELTCQFKKIKISKKVLAQFLNLDVPVFPIKGKDIIENFNFERKHVGNILKKVEKWWVGKNFIPDKKKCLNMVEKL